MLFCASFAAAAPLNPATYWGYVEINEEKAPDGTVLIVETEDGEILANQTLPLDVGYLGSYNVILNLDDPHTSEDEGGDEGEVLVWYVDGIRALEPLIGEDILEEGSVNNDFTIIGIRNPKLVPSYSYPSRVLLGEMVNLTILMDNQGDGKGTAAIMMGAIEGVSDSVSESGIELNIDEIVVSNIVLDPQKCGVHNINVLIDYYNEADDLVESLGSDLEFEVEGNDLIVQSVDAQTYSAFEGEDVPITLAVKNTGDEDVGGFTVELYEVLADRENKLETIEMSSGVSVGEVVTVSYNYDTGGRNLSQIKAKVVMDKPECNVENNEMLSREIKIFEEPVEEVVEEVVEDRPVQQPIVEFYEETEPVVDDGAPVGYMFLPNITSEENPIDKVLVIILIVLIGGNLIFFTIYKGNLKITLPSLPKLPKKDKEEVDVEKVNEVIEQDRIREDAPAEEDNTEEEKREEIKKHIETIVNKEKGKQKRKELVKNKVAKVKSNLSKKKIERVLMQKGDEKKGSFMPYEYLVDASKIISFIHNNRKPRYELIESLGKKYPLFLVDLGIRAVYSSKNLDHNYSNKNFDRVKPDENIYAYVTYWNLVKAVKIMAEKLAIERMDKYNNKEIKSILFNKWKKDQPLVAFLYKEFF